MRPFFSDSARVAIVIVATATMTMTMTTTRQIVGAAQSGASSDTGFGSDWPVYHQDGLGGGVDTSGTDLSPATVAWTSTALDGQIFGEPLVEAGGVIVATENDTVYELNPDTGAVIWSTHVGTAVPSGDLPCGDISPTVGITGTPVIDPTRGEVFAVTDELVDSSAQHYLVGIDLVTGEVLLHQAISLPGVDQAAQLQRTGLTLDDGNVVEGFGGNDGDCGYYHGWVISIPEDGGAQQSFEVASASGDSQGAVWMGGAAPIVDASGNIWLATGNSAFSSSSDTYDNGDAVIELNSDLVEQQFFAPSTWYSDNGSDLDLGSSSPVLLGSGFVFQAGKSKIAYVMSNPSLGGVGGQLASADSYCGADVDGGSAVVGNVVYTPCQRGVVKTQVTPGNPPTITSIWQTSTGSGGPPIVAGGLVWTIDPSNGELYGLDPSTGNASQTFALGSEANHFPTPTVADGLLLAASTNQVYAFDGPAGLPPTPTATAASATSSTITLGQSDTDIVDVTGNASDGSPSGVVTFDVCGPTAGPTPCTSTANPVGSPMDLVAGTDNTATVISTPFTPDAGGYWCFAGYYSGDANYSPSSEANTTECFDVAPTITSAETTTFTEGAPAIPFQVTSVGGYGPITYSETGTLPSGVTLSSTGVLSGTPEWLPGSFPFTITATDASGITAAQDFVLIVATSPELHITTTSPLPTAQVGLLYTLTLTADGGATPYRWSIVSSVLPRGLRLDTKTGAISGRPTPHAHGHVFEVQVRHGNEKVKASFSISVT
jgi:outer membrane protein assembly factor BamB